MDTISLRAASRLAFYAAVALIVSCGGGDPQHDRDADSRTARALAVTPPPTFFPNVSIPANANTYGMWSPVYNWPEGVAVHAVILPDGHLLTFGSTASGFQTAHVSVDIWDSTVAPDMGHLTLPNNTGTDFFCSSNVLLPPDGGGAPPKVFIAGGDNWTGSVTTNGANPNSNVLDLGTNTLTRQRDMQRPRWYSTSITLANGETYIQGGTGGTDRPEVRGVNGVFRLLGGADTSSLDFWFPRNYAAPDGRVFGYDSTGRMYYVDTSGSGTFTSAGQFASQYAHYSATSAMFRPGRILQVGGNSNAAAVIDINGAAPVLTPTQSLSAQRQWANATVLPDGKVLVTGGSQNDTSNDSTAPPVNPSFTAEIWNPVNEQWLLGASAAKARGYHSTAVLLPDAAVLVAGTGARNPDNPTVNQLNAEIYYPPYFFAANGVRASRPIIASAPDWVDIGKVIGVSVANAASVSRVTLVKTSATTHSFNMDQRFLELTFAANGLDLSVQMPAHARDATPGHYMLFVFNESGVPSVAKIVRMGIASVPDPAVVPTLATPPTQVSNVGASATLALIASDPNGDPLTYSATGLPPGLSLYPTSGVISGTPTSAGNYSVTATVTDGVNLASANFLWTINAVNGVVITSLQPAANTLAGTSASFTASTQGGTNVIYRWNFGDGTGDTPWSPTGTVSHTYANPGTYSVTLSVNDDSLVLQSRTFLQTVALPATANKPSASSNIVIQSPTGSDPRLWVVNQDNDSVSVFNTVTRAKLAEIAVGSAPRSIAVAANGLIWVTNKRSDSISVIDPATNAVVNTVALPRASQPFGIVMSPSTAQAFVVLEATGQLLKFDTGSGAQLGAVSVGPNPRHVSINADRTNVYVSRFITPPLPGESTATVSPTPGNGAEVVVVNAGSMGVVSTIVLQHSDKPDLENQGRGIPNYLGAATISPDGTQAFVPSKQDNIKRGMLRDGTGLNFQNTVRAISSRIVLATGQEDLSKRVDHDNASVASAGAYDTRGVYLFVALETSREVAVVDAFSGSQVMRFDVGRAPQGLVVSGDGKTLYVNNFMDRTVGVYDLQPLLSNGQLSVPLVAMLSPVGAEKLAAQVLLGKQLFYDARDVRLARDRYMSCATCHNDGGNDGRTWDFTGQGEGLRNTIALRGRAGAQGLLHWSGNFDEVQDFEGQIRALSGGTGLMSDTAFNTGTRSQPLGDLKAGISTDLDALAGYVASLNTFEPSPYRTASGTLTATGSAGRAVFQAQNCVNCHGGTAFTASASLGLQNIGTLKPSSGQRLGAPLTGIDIPTLRDVWRTAPYLHDGSATTLGDAVTAHNGVNITSADLASLVQYLKEIGSDEPVALYSASAGLVAAYGFNEGTGAVLADLSGNGNNGTISNATWTTAGKYGSALTFNGTNAVVTVPNASSLQLTTGMTLEAWVFPTSAPAGWRAVVDKNVDGYYLMASSDQSNRPAVGGTWAAGNRNATGPSTLATNIWTHLAATFDGATIQIYVNGVQVANAPQTTSLVTTSGTLQIGGDSYPGEFFAGLIDEVRIYNRALSTAEIGADMNTPLTPVADITPPVLSNGQPGGTLAGGTTQATLSLTSNENATCRYSTIAGTAYTSMTSAFSTTGGTTHSTPVSGLANGQTYRYYVRCQDSSGNADTADFTISFSVASPDATPPTVSISAPSAGATVTGSVTVSASASDNVGVAGVQFLLDGAPLGAEVTAIPYTLGWNTAGVSNGVHAVSARARDAAGNQTTSAAVSVTVSNAATSSLVAAYSFNEGTGTVLHDVSGNGNNGTINNATWTTAGKYGPALNFNGTNAYVDLGNPTSLQFTGSMTVSAWIRTTAFPVDDAAIVSKRSSSAIGFQLDTSVDTGPRTVGFKLASSTGALMARYSSTVLQANTWYYVTGVYDASAQTMSVYVNGVLNNGVLRGTVTATQQNSTVNVNVGRRTGAGNFNFNGTIDEVRIYNRALSATEIAADMNTQLTQVADTTPPTVSISAPSAGATVTGSVTVSASASDNVGVAGVQFLLDGAPLGAEVTAIPYTLGWNTAGVSNGVHAVSARARDAAGNQTTSAAVSVTVSNAATSSLVAAYSFNEGTGTVLHDVSGNGNNGTINNATWTTAGKYGPALNFNGTNAYVDLGNPTSLQFTGSMTVSAWIRTTAFPADDAAIVSKRSSNAIGFQLDTSVDTGPRTVGFKLASSTGALMARYSSTVLQANTWYYVTGVYDASARTMSVYVNGVLNNGALRGTVTATQQNSTVNVNVGRRTGAGKFNFNGTIDEVRIYNRALSATEIAADMNTAQ